MDWGLTFPQLGFNSQVVTISPNGHHLVYIGQSDTGNGNRLYHRDLTDETFGEPQPVPGTDGAIFAFFSPDSSTLGFLTTDRIWKWELESGAPMPTQVCAAHNPTSATWVRDGSIYFTDQDGQTLNHKRDGKDKPEKLFNPIERFGNWAQISSILPGGRAALASVLSQGSISCDGMEIRVISLDSPGGGEGEPLGIHGYGVRYLRSGHVVYCREGSLFAVPFDLDLMKTTGVEKRVLNNVTQESLFGVVHASVSDNGTLAFVPGEDLSRGRLSWLDRQGGKGVVNSM